MLPANQCQTTPYYTCLYKQTKSLAAYAPGSNTHLARTDVAGGDAEKVGGVFVGCRLSGGAGGEDADRSTCRLAALGWCCVGLGWGWAGESGGKRLGTAKITVLHIFRVELYSTWYMLGTFYVPKTIMAL